MNLVYSLVLPAIAALVFSFGIGYGFTHSIAGAFAALLTTATLSVLETSVSFDNALVNANVLRHMSPIWRRRFLTWGMIIAVFGIRLLAPALLASGLAGISPWHALALAFSNPDSYATMMQASHIPLAGFGGGFLIMVALDFFVDSSKDTHWIKILEKPMAWISRVPGLKIALGAAIVCAASYLPAVVADQSMLLASGIFGIVGHLAVRAVGWLSQAPSSSTGGAKRSGLAQFAYLELIDASLSFDGVIAAFALTNNFLLIAAGLGVGALAVRTLTLRLVDVQSFDKIKYVEHGTFYAIGALAGFLLVGSSVAIPGLITGFTGIVIIGASILHSFLERADVRSKVRSIARTSFRSSVKLGIASLIAAWSQSIWTPARGRVVKAQTQGSEVSESASLSPQNKSAKAEATTQPASQDGLAEQQNLPAVESPAIDDLKKTLSDAEDSDAQNAFETLASALKEADAFTTPRQIKTDAKILLAALEQNKTPRVITAQLFGNRVRPARPTEVLNQLAQIRQKYWQDDLGTLSNSEARVLQNLFSALGDHSWGDILARKNAGCADELIKLNVKPD